jgi:SAM-dependent methyltransferase
MLEPKERLYRERIMRKVRHLLQPGMRVLDAGCGPGAGAELLAALGCKVLAVDERAYPEWEQRRGLGIEFQTGSAEKLPFADASFDAVWMMDALHHMEWPEKALAELVRVAKPAAPVIVIETNRQSPITFVRMTLLAGHQTFGRRKMRRLLSGVQPGFKFFMVETRCLPWNWPWALGLLNIASNVLEGLRVLNPWLTYQVGILTGQGRPVAAVLDATESPAQRRARKESEAIA